MIKGFASASKIGENAYATVVPVGSDKHGVDVAPKAIYELDEYTIDSSKWGTDNVLGSYSYVTITGIVDAKIGDVLRFIDGDYVNTEYSIIRVDGDDIYLSSYVREDLSGLTVKHMRYLTLTVGADGSLAVSSGPTQIVVDGVDTEIEVDTVDPTNNVVMPTEDFVTIDGVKTPVNVDTSDSSNNVASPTQLYIQRDGVTEPITKDTVTPANTKAIPVELVSSTGVEATINVTTGDLQVEISHDGATHTWDSTRLGDGTTLARIKPDATDVGFGELKVNDADINTVTGTIADVKEIDPDEDATVIQLLKGQMQKLIDLEGEISSGNVKNDTTEDYYRRDFTSSPLATASGFVTLRTLTSDINKINITNNSGNELVIRNATTTKQIIVGQGAVFSQALVGVIGENIEISSVNADSVDGIIYINFEG